MPRKNRSLPTYHMLLVIGTMLLKEANPSYGNEIMSSTGMPSGTLYPIMNHLVLSGIVTKGLERGDPKKLDRPLRVYYRLTLKGKRFGKCYNTKAIAANPPLVPFGDF